jgi:hypothetical protein
MNELESGSSSVRWTRLIDDVADSDLSCGVESSGDMFMAGSATSCYCKDELKEWD